MAGDAGAAAPGALGSAHLAGAPSILEFLRQASVDVPGAGAGDRNACETDEPLSAGPFEHRRSRLPGLLVLRPATARARQQSHGSHGQPCVNDPAADVAGAFAPFLRLALGL